MTFYILGYLIITMRKMSIKVRVLRKIGIGYFPYLHKQLIVGMCLYSISKTNSVNLLSTLIVKTDS